MPKRKANEEEEGEGGETINLVIVDQENNRVYYKMRLDTKMKTLFRSYGQKRKQHHAIFDFFHGNTRITIKPNSTPAKLGMEDGDIITVLETKMGA